jgi:hypothetical protein
MKQANLIEVLRTYDAALRENGAPALLLARIYRRLSPWLAYLARQRERNRRQNAFKHNLPFDP